jgi:hypothetical protein
MCSPHRWCCRAFVRLQEVFQGSGSNVRCGDPRRKGGRNGTGRGVRRTASRSTAQDEGQTSFQAYILAKFTGRYLTALLGHIQEHVIDFC